MCIRDSRYIMDRETRQPIVIPDSQMRSFIAVSGTYDQAVLYLEPTELNPVSYTHLDVYKRQGMAYGILWPVSIHDKIKNMKRISIIYSLILFCMYLSAQTSPELSLIHI